MRTEYKASDKGSRRPKTKIFGAQTSGALSSSASTEFKFALPEWPYNFWDLPPVPSAAFDRFTEDRFITTKMLTVSPMSSSTDLVHFETRIYEEIAAYEEATGGPLRCDGFASRGEKGIGRLEAHLVFRKRPNMILLKKLMRKIGSTVITGDYDPAEDWTRLSQEYKNHPPHNGCLHYTSQHAEHPDNRRLWNNPDNRKTVAVAPVQEQDERDASFQRDLEEGIWLGQNKQPKTWEVENGEMVEGELRLVRGAVMMELPIFRRSELPNGTVVTLKKGKPNNNKGKLT